MPPRNPSLPNLLIKGENLQALQALLPEFSPTGAHPLDTGAVRCVYIDPPYNTGERRAGMRGYADASSSAAWQAMMRERLELLRRCLRPDGSLFVHIDDNEMDALKLAMDELFGRECFIGRVTVAARSPSAFSTVNRGVFKASEYILWYARDRAAFRQNQLRVPRAPDRAYRMWLDNPEQPFERWTFSRLREACPPGQELQRFQVQHADRVCRLAVISDRKASKAALDLKVRSKAEPERVLRLEREGRDPIYVLRGQQLLFYGRQVVEIDGQRCASSPLTNVWTDIPWEGIAREGGVRFKFGKKPERLLRRVLQLASDPGDLVLDAFGGAGTTAAVAHKMGRRWVSIEQGAQIDLCRERLQRVCSGEDQTGVSKVEGWTGGGSFEERTLDGAGGWATAQ